MNDPDLDRSLIDAARAELGPTEAQRQRLRRSVVAAVGATVGATAATAGTASAAATGAGVATWKVTALVVAGLAVAGGAAWTVAAPEGETPSPSARAPREALAAPVNVASVHVPPNVALDQAAEEPPAPAELVVTAQASAAEPPGAVERPAVRPRIAAPAPAPRADEELAAPEHALIAETALLQSAHRALRSNAPDRALAHLSAHAARYPNGALREERAATRVLALCALERRAEARAEAAAFLAAHPSSMHAARVRAACAAP